MNDLLEMFWDVGMKEVGLGSIRSQDVKVALWDSTSEGRLVH